MKKIEIIDFAKYCKEVFSATQEEVERALRLEEDITEAQIEKYRNAEYILLDRIMDPDMNRDAVRQMYKEVEKLKLPKGFMVALEDSYYDKPGSLVQVAVAIKCKNKSTEYLLPQSLDFA